MIIVFSVNGHNYLFHSVRSNNIQVASWTPDQPAEPKTTTRWQQHTTEYMKY